MEGNQRRAVGNRDFSNLAVVERILIPTQAQFGGERHGYSLAQGAKSLPHFFRRAHHAGASPTGGYAGGTAAQVDIKKIRREFAVDRGGAFRHARRVIIQELGAKWAFGGAKGEPAFLVMFLVGEVQGVDKFGDGERGAEFAGDPAERRVGDTVHGRQDELPVNRNAADVEGGRGGFRHTPRGFARSVCPGRKA